MGQSGVRIKEDHERTTNLLGLDGVGEFRGESDMGNGHIVQDKVETLRALSQVISHQTRHLYQSGDRQLVARAR